jgi:hypothetical protein
MVRNFGSVAVIKFHVRHDGLMGLFAYASGGKNSCSFAANLPLNPRCAEWVSAYTATAK